MDKLVNPIEPCRMRSRMPPSPWGISRPFRPPRRRLTLRLFLVAGALAGCSTAPPKQVGDDLPQIDTSTDESRGGDPRLDRENKQKALSSGAKGAERKDTSIPDDYTLTERDCDTLGKQYGAVARSDQLVALSPKLTDKQRAVAEVNIDKGIGTLESRWTENCIKSLVGKVADRNALKCAMGSRTVHEFKACVGDDSGPAKGGKK